MKTKKLLSLFMAAALVVFAIPQYATKAEAAVLNYQRAQVKYQDAYNSTIYDVTANGVSNAGKNDAGAPISALVKKLAKARTDETQPIVIYMPSGTYKLTSAIKLNTYPNVHLIAENDTVVTTSKAVRDLIEIQNTSNVSVLGGKWNGNNKATYVIKLYKARDIMVSELQVSKAKDRGIHISATTVTLSGIASYSNKVNGISTAQGANVTMLNSKVYKNGQHGVVVASSTFHMENGGNKIYNNGYNGVSVSKSSSKLYASGNSFTGNGTAKTSVGHGIGVAEGSYAEISNNTIEKNKQCGISLINKGKAVVTGNTIKSNGRHGIGSAEKSTLTAKDNTISGNKWHGIMARDKGKITATGNNISKNSVAGISVEGLSGTINNNTIKQNKSNGIIAVSGKITLTGNSITKNKAFGVYTEGSTKVTLVTANVIKSNSKGDINAEGATLKMGKGNKVGKIKK